MLDVKGILIRNWRGDCSAPEAMTIRVTATVDTWGTLLKVDGRLTVEDVEELARAFRAAQGTAALELSDLQSADQAGVKTLRELVALGAEVRGASPYIELLLKTRK